MKERTEAQSVNEGKWQVHIELMYPIHEGKHEISYLEIIIEDDSCVAVGDDTLQVISNIDGNLIKHYVPMSNVVLWHMIYLHSKNK